MSGLLAACPSAEPPPAGPPPSPAAPPAPVAARPDLPRLVPDVGIGPFRVGMTRGEFSEAARAAGLAEREGYSEANAYAGPYFVAFTDEGARLSTILVSLKDGGGLNHPDGVLPPTMTVAEDVAALLRCGNKVLAMGGHYFKCEGRVTVHQELGGGGVSIRVESAETAALIADIDRGADSNP
jgi:hypothetical protein